jgi:hypothetical protein
LVPKKEIVAETAKSENDVHGLEYDWIACDVDGLVALFSTAGGGYLPLAFLQDTDAHERAIEDILDGPATTIATFAPALSPSLKNIWRSAAEHGLFAFDSDVNGGPYKVVAVPAVPRRLDSLSVDVIRVATRIRIRASFAGESLLTEDRIREAAAD